MIYSLSNFLINRHGQTSSYISNAHEAKIQCVLSDTQFLVAHHNCKDLNFLLSGLTCLVTSLPFYGLLINDKRIICFFVQKQTNTSTDDKEF